MKRVLIFSCLLLVGCFEGTKKNPSANPPLAETTSSTVNIRSETEQIVQEAPSVKPHADNIVKETKDIDKSTAEVTKIIAEKDKIITTQATVIEDDKNSAKKHIQTITYMIAGIAFAALVASGIALALGYLKSMIPLLLSGATLLSAIAFGWLITWFFIIGPVTVGLTVLCLGYIVWHKHQQVKNTVATNISSDGAPKPQAGGIARVFARR